MSLKAIEPFNTLGLRETEAGPERVVIAVPLEGNRNDKGTLFGGSMYSAMLLAGWRLCTLSAEQSSLTGDIFVKDSSVRFLRPVLSDMTAVARLSAAPGVTPRGNMAFEVDLDAFDGAGEVCGQATASYRLVVKRR